MRSTAVRASGELLATTRGEGGGGDAGNDGGKVEIGDGRWRIDEAMALLGEMATAAGVGFAETHGGQKRKRDNPTRSAVGRATHHARLRQRRTAHGSDE